MKSSPPTYVKNCLFPSFQHVVSACHGGSLVTNTPNNSEKNQSVDKHVEIRRGGLISTTNSEAIVRSNTIIDNTNSTDNNRRFSLKNIKGLKINTSLKIKKRNETPTPGTCETVCSMEDSPVSMQVLNVKALTKKFNQSNIKA